MRASPRSGTGPPGTGRRHGKVGERKPGNAPSGASRKRPDVETPPRLGGEQGQARRTPRKTGNMANPRIGSRVQQTCEVPGGANRRSREERQGRNESGRWHSRAEGGSASPGNFPREASQRPLSGAAGPLGVDTRHPCRWRGGSMTTPREESDNRTDATSTAARSRGERTAGTDSASRIESPKER